LPDFLLLVAFGFPLLTDDLRNLGVCKSRIVGDDGLLVVLAIKNKCLKESAADEYLSANKDSFLCCKWRETALGTSPPGIKNESDLPFLGRGILGSGWQRQTCPDSSPDPVDEALPGGLEPAGLSARPGSSPSTDAGLFPMT
jgi:hypothetical protein